MEESFANEYSMAYSIKSLKPRSVGSQETETSNDPMIKNLKFRGALGSLVTCTSIEIALFPTELIVKTTTYRMDPGSRGFVQRKDPGAWKDIEVGGILSKHSAS